MDTIVNYIKLVLKSIFQQDYARSKTHLQVHLIIDKLNMYIIQMRSTDTNKW